MNALSRHRVTLLLIGAVLLILVVVVVTGAGQDSGRPLDPASHSPDGARATARVLSAQGVRVDVARGADALTATAPDSDTTVLVTSTDQLGESTLRRLRDDAHDSRVVLVEPPPTLTELLHLPAGAGVAPGTTQAGCDETWAEDVEIAVDSAYAYPTSQGCYATDAGYLVASADDLVLLGAGQIMSNDQVLRADNAAVTLRLLGAHDRVVWYVPNASDLTGADAGRLSDLLPRWLAPALWTVLLATLGLMLWRGRRLGPLVREPLPVTVRAIETTHSRGRLYRRAGDRYHAAQALRAAAREDAARALKLPPHVIAQPDVLVRALAQHTGRSPEELDALLGPRASTPTHDHDLITLAGQLAELDREVRRP